MSKAPNLKTGEVLFNISEKKQLKSDGNSPECLSALESNNWGERSFNQTLFIETEATRKGALCVHAFTCALSQVSDPLQKKVN